MTTNSFHIRVMDHGGPCHSYRRPSGPWLRQMADAARVLTSALLVVVALLFCVVSARAETVTFGPPAGNDDWSNSSNWSPAGPEGNDVEIGDYSTTVDADFTIGSLTLADGAAVGIASGKTLNITGSATDNGTITVDSNEAAGLSTLNFDDGAVSGQGTISLTLDHYAEITGTLTQEFGHTISGSGEITAAFTNNGYVYAISNFMPLTLETSDMVNNGSMGGVGGTLDINGITITQGINGQIFVLSGGAVFFNGNTTINGGEIYSQVAGGLVIVESGTTTFNSITNGATVYINLGNTVNVTGSLTDDGMILVSSGGEEGNSILNVSGATVLGSGTFTLMEPSSESQLTGTLTQAPGHTINGQGNINAALTNNGLMNADVSGGTLSVNGATSNGGLMEASNGGTLSFAPGALTNLSGFTLAGGAYEAGANSTISLPGSVTTNAATVVLDGTGSEFSAFNSVATNNGEFEIIGGRTFSTAGPLINAGTLLTGTGSALAVNGLLTQNPSGTLAGSGTFSATALELSGTISPGDAPGTLTLAGATIFESTLTLAYQLGSVSGTNDHLDVNGDFTLAGTLDITALAGFGAGDYDIIDYGGGTFTDDTLDVGSAPGGFDYEISSATPGQVDLMVIEVPEPATWAIILCGLGALSLRKRRRRQ